MLAEHGGIKSGGHLEQMLGGLDVEVGHQAVRQQQGVNTGVQGHRVANNPEGIVEALGIEVQLEPVTGGEHDRPPDQARLQKIPRQLGPTVG